MGVIKRGILGGFSGSVANVVGSSWKGIAVMKAKPLSVANPRTAGQVGQRTRFSAVVSDASELLVDVVKPLWDRFAQQQSGYNAFISKNIEAFDNQGNRNAADYVTSIGTLTGAEDFSISATNGSPNVNFNWTDNSGEGSALGPDEAYYVAINNTTNVVFGGFKGETREDEAGVLVMPEDNATGDIVAGYLAFRRVDGTLVSNSSVDIVTVA